MMKKYLAILQPGILPKQQLTVYYALLFVL
nr:MAG TPA: hypothetical protein [Caudoviricetes sp.]